VIMVIIVILFPQMVMHYKTSGTQLNEQQMQKQIESITPQNLDIGPLKLQ
jgi:hypothetical protein